MASRQELEINTYKTSAPRFNSFHRASSNLSPMKFNLVQRRSPPFSLRQEQQAVFSLTQMVPSVAVLASQNTTTTPMSTYRTRLPPSKFLPHGIQTENLGEYEIGLSSPLVSELGWYGPQSRISPLPATSARRSGEPVKNAGAKRGVGRKCAFPLCKNSSRSRGYCYSHGGGRRCSIEGCPNGAVSRDLCKRHGGGRRCKAVGCRSSSESGGLCYSHGGGKRCSVSWCSARSKKGGLCVSHLKAAAKEDDLSNPALKEEIEAVSFSETSSMITGGPDTNMKNSNGEWLQRTVVSTLLSLSQIENKEHKEEEEKDFGEVKKAQESNSGSYIKSEPETSRCSSYSIISCNSSDSTNSRSNRFAIASLLN